MNARNYKELKRDFTSMPMEFRPVPFYHMDGRFAENGKLTEDVAKNIALYKKSGYGGIVPLPVSAQGGHAGTEPEFGTPEYYEDYGALLAKAKELGMSVIYNDDVDFPSGRAGGEIQRKYPGSTAQMLSRFEYKCMEGQNVSRALQSGDATAL